MFSKIIVLQMTLMRNCRCTLQRAEEIVFCIFTYSKLQYRMQIL